MEENKPVNPYQAPAAETMAAATAPDTGAFRSDPKAAAAERGWDWIAGGWKLFTVAPVIWIIDLVILFAIFFMIGLIPLLGNVASNVLYPVFGAGLMLTARAAAQGETPEVSQLFGGFKERAGALMLVGLLNLVGVIAITCLVAAIGMVMFGMSGLFSALLGGDKAGMVALVSSLSLSVLILGLLFVALYLPLVMAGWFAPALVLFHGMEPLAAMKLSFRACLRNFIPYLLWGVIMLIFIVIGAIPLGLGLLVVMPVMMASTYVAYRDIFIADAA